MKVRILNSPYYDNYQLHAVGSEIEVPDDFNLGRQGNFGVVDAKGDISIPTPKRDVPQNVAKPDYEWKKVSGEVVDKPVPMFSDKMARPAPGSERNVPLAAAHPDASVAAAAAKKP